jgi:GT2 family glycosyltransferase
MTPPQIRSVSVIVPSGGWPESLDACLQSLCRQTIRLPVEIIVVINGPESGSGPTNWPGVTILRAPVRGPAAARNAGVSASHGDVLAFTDADCIADPRWLAAAVEAIGADAANVVVAGAISRSGAGLNAVSLYDSVTFLTQEAYVKWSHALVTANMVLHRAVFDRVGPFDHRFRGAAFEDWDWSLRARRERVTLRYAEHAIVDHPCMSQASQLQAKMRRLADGEITFRRKYRRHVRRPNAIVIVWHHATRAWANTQLNLSSRVRLFAVGVVAGFWRWQGFHRGRRAAPGRRPDVRRN